MDDSVEKAVIGLAVAAVSGLTFIAYKHPKAYAKLAVGIAVLMAPAMVFGFGWNFGVLAAHRAVSLATDPLSPARQAAQSAEISIWYLWGLPTAMLAYLGFLNSFPYWLLEKEPPKNEGDQE